MPLVREFSELPQQSIQELLYNIDPHPLWPLWLKDKKLVMEELADRPLEAESLNRQFTSSNEILTELKETLQIDNLMGDGEGGMEEYKVVNTKKGFTLRYSRISSHDIGLWNLKDSTLTEAFLGKFMDRLRSDFRNGKKPVMCNRCWDEEDTGITSKRITFAEHFSGSQGPIADRIPDTIFTEPVTDKNITYVDLKLGNICNLKCRICNSMSSSKWAQEDIDSLITFDGLTKERIKRGQTREGGIIDSIETLPYRQLKLGNWPRENKSFWRNIKEDVLPNLTYLEFTGGEPLLIQEQFDLIQQVVDDGLAKNIHLSYNTNGTQLPIHAIENLWPHFKTIRLSFSIDDLGKRFEYQRQGAKWDKVHNNITYMLNNKSDNMYIEITTTINILNIMNLPDIHGWLLTLPNFIGDPKSPGQAFWYINLLHMPAYLNIGLLPDNAKAEIKHRLTSYDWYTPSYTTGNSFNDGIPNNILNTIEYMHSGVILDPDTSHNMDLTVLRAKAREKIYKHDHLRKENLQDIDPWLASMLQYDYKEMEQLWLPAR
jgi:pyruvate-formate lyase-activating enzyme